MLNTISGTAATFYIIPLFFFFVECTRNSKITFKANLLFISSLSYAIFVLAYLGRDGLLFWSFSFIAIFLLFKKFIRKSNRKSILKYFLRILIVFVCIFMVISIARFATKSYTDSESGNVILSLFSYLGQGPINFSEFFYLDIKTMDYGRNMFPLLFGDRIEGVVYSESYGLNSWVFKTFIYPIWSGFGTVLTLVIGLSLFTIYKCTFKKDRASKKYSFSFVLCYFLFFQIYSQGVFYFRMYNMVGNLFILVLLTMILVFKFVPQESIVKTLK